MVDALAANMQHTQQTIHHITSLWYHKEVSLLQVPALSSSLREEGLRVRRREDLRVRLVDSLAVVDALAANMQHTQQTIHHITSLWYHKEVSLLQVPATLFLLGVGTVDTFAANMQHTQQTIHHNTQQYITA